MAVGGDFTAWLASRAGLAPGQTVLDYGCGNGDISILAARMVGPSGSVLGIDVDDDVLSAAAERTRGEGLDNVTFRKVDLSAIPDDLGTFDAMIGRRVLMYVPDPQRAVASLVQHLAKGGVFISHEHDFAFDHPANPSLPAHRKAKDLVLAMLDAEGAKKSLGRGLHRLLDTAGLVVEGFDTSAILQTRDQPYPIGEMIAATQVRMIEAGLFKEGELDHAQLSHDLAEERASLDFYWADTMFGAWGRKT